MSKKFKKVGELHGVPVFKSRFIETPYEKAQRETVETIARNIVDLTKAVEALINGPLKRKALVVLLANSSGLPQTTVDRVLKSLQDLQGDWLNK